MKEKCLTEQLQELAEDICDNYCKFRDSCDDNAECEVIRSGGKCPLDLLM